MCGIAGIYQWSGDSVVDRDELLRIRDQMTTRGPDGAGIWISPDERLGLASRRLAIIDLSEAGAQPMVSADGNVVIVFNGEIYNHRELRHLLVAKGRTFRSTSDTEVLLQLYAEKGIEMLRHLRGMFAFALWDAAQQRLLLARDTFGIKPLYYTADNGSLRFASQVRAIIAGGATSQATDAAAAAGFLLTGSVPEPLTIYESIRALPAGSFILIDGRRVQPVRRFDSVTERIVEAEKQAIVEHADPRGTPIRDALVESLRYHFVSDVPVGVFLSSGIDSAALLGFAREAGFANLRTITLAFDEFRGTPLDESAHAAEVAALYGAEHETHVLSAADIERQLDGALEAMDQPSIDGINSYFVSQAAAERGLKVMLSGLGGDELFGGYPSFREVPKLASWGAITSRVPFLAAAFSHLNRLFTRQTTTRAIKRGAIIEYGRDVAAAYFLKRALFLPHELGTVLGDELARDALARLALLDHYRTHLTPRLRTDHGIVAALEASLYMRNQLLRDADWASMAHSVELRVPYVDVDLWRRSLPHLVRSRRNGKQLLASLPRPAIPDVVRQRRKTGFTVPARAVAGKRGEMGIADPMRRWAASVLRGWPPPRRPIRILYLHTDSYGSSGGIALYNRDMIRALASHSEVSEIVAVPRHLGDIRPDEVPTEVRIVAQAAGSKARFVRRVAAILRREPSFSIVVCGHINLLSLATLAARRTGAPLILTIFGIEAWQPTGSVFNNRLAKTVQHVVSISRLTAERFRRWSGTAADPVIIPNAIHLDEFTPGKPDRQLMERFGLEGRTVLLTLGRLISRERYKGFDEVLDILPRLRPEFPSLRYVIAGEGSDRARLEKKAKSLGVDDLVVFAGFVSDAERLDLYRAADVYVMPSRGEGFGFVFLEALACGVPVVASSVDGSYEAVLEGTLGSAVDPDDKEALHAAIVKALGRTSRDVRPELMTFSYSAFERKVHELVDRIANEQVPTTSDHHASTRRRAPQR